MALLVDTQYKIVCDLCRKPARASWDRQIDDARHRALGRDWIVKQYSPYTAYCPECQKLLEDQKPDGNSTLRRDITD
jgi:thymidine kinase